MNTKSPKEQFIAWLDRHLTDHKPGTYLPSDKQLAATWSISQSTVRRVLGEYAEKGLLTRIQGKGTLIGETEPQTPMPAQRNSSVEDTAKALSDMISRGVFKQTEALPQIKSISMQLKVGPSTVIAAYGRLCKNGIVTKIGKTYWIGSPERRILDIPIRRLFAFHGPRIDFPRLYQQSVYAPAYMKMERELYRHRFKISYRSVDQFHELASEWLNNDKYPNSLLFAHILHDAIKPLEHLIQRIIHHAGTYKPNILIIGEQHTRPMKGISFFHEKNTTTQLCRFISRYVSDNQFVNTYMYMDRSAQFSYPGFKGYLKLYPEMHHFTYSGNFRYLIKHDPDIQSRENFLTFIFKGKKRDDMIPIASKYNKTIRSQVENDIILCENFSQAYPEIGEKDLWIFEHDKDAESALSWVSNRGIKVPEHLSIISLQNDPAFLHCGISCCVKDWDTMGYLMAHALIGDIPIAKSSHGFIRTEPLMLERKTTP